MGSRYVQPLRIVIQWCFLFFCGWLGIRLYQFVAFVCSDGSMPAVHRPDGVEGFLPIAALVGLRDWVQSGSLNPVHPAAVVILLTVIGVSLLLRRSFCSWICPVGTIEEFLWKRGFTLFRRNLRLPRWLDVICRAPKYLLLAFFLVSICLQMPAAQVSAFIASDYNKIADIRLLEFFRHLSGVPLVFLVITLLLSLPLRNPFCRFLCPYGALLGLVALLSPTKVTRDRHTCVACGVCSQFCPTAIPVMGKTRVHSPECIGCWRCISYCRAEGALAMKLPGRRLAVPGIVFALLVVLVFLGGTGIGKWTDHWRTGIDIGEYRRLLLPAQR